ncbi:nitrilase-related carbon-nitrogen hydrolase [Amycolatopsis minnesotensis]|uniref:Apolipoprotein N-acyltransferase n=1 Tax=Amycolatopsis minnesotensis TaxID=337894 RepID=A0ABN2RTV4_9PSEU
MTRGMTKKPYDVRLAAVAVLAAAVLWFFGTGLAPVAALTWLAPLPMFLLAPRVPGKVAFGGTFAGILLGTTNSWYWYAKSHDLPMWPWGLVASLTFALTLAVAVLLFRALLGRGRPLLAVAAAPAVWVGVLHLVSLAPSGIMGTLATTQSDLPVVLQMASVTGALGIDYLVLLVPVAIAAWFAPGARGRGRIAVTAGAAVLVCLGGGALRLAGAEDSPPQRVALVAGNQKGWAADLATPAGKRLLDAYVDRLSALPSGVRTAVLPEAAFGSKVARPPELIEPMRRLATTKGMDLVVGFAWWDGNLKYNYALVFPAEGGEPAVYLKQHDMVSPKGHDLVFVPGHGREIGIEICGDVAHTDTSAAYGRTGSRMLAIPASTEDDNGWQASRTALVRGVENGQAVLWGGRQAVLSVNDGWGRVRAEKATGEGGEDAFTTVVSEVAGGPGATLYSRFGDWFEWLCVALGLFAMLVAAYGSREGAAEQRSGPGRDATLAQGGEAAH